MNKNLRFIKNNKKEVFFMDFRTDMAVERRDVFRNIKYLGNF